MIDLIVLDRRTPSRNSATLSVEQLPDALAGLGDWPFNWFCARIPPPLGKDHSTPFSPLTSPAERKFLTDLHETWQRTYEGELQRSTHGRDMQVDHRNILLNTYE